MKYHLHLPIYRYNHLQKYSQLCESYIIYVFFFAYAIGSHSSSSDNVFLFFGVAEYRQLDKEIGILIICPFNTKNIADFCIAHP